jgi:hypothetical protein
MDAASSLRLEAELESIVTAVSGGHRADLVLTRMGWRGEGPRTIREVAKRYGVSHGLVQILCTGVLSSLRNRPVYAPALDRALALVEANIGQEAQEAQAAKTELLESGICVSQFHPKGVVTAARALGRKTRVDIARFGATERIVTEQLILDVRSASQRALVAIAKRGAVKIGDVLRDGCGGVSLTLTARILQEMDADLEICWATIAEWLSAVGPTVRNPVVRVVRKVLAVGREVEIGEIRRAISRMSPRQVPLPQCVLAGICAAMPDVVVSPRGTISARVAIPLDSVLTPTELALLEIFDGPAPVKVPELRARWQETGAPLLTLRQALQCSPVIQRVALGVYRIIGSNRR